MRVPVNTPLLNGREKEYLIDCIDTGWISSEGPYVKKFEQGVASFVGQKHGIAVANGTAALETAVLSLNLQKGSEVILPDFTIISCVQAIVKAGLVPVPVDCLPDTWNMDVSQIESKITPKTRAIMVVHIYGLPVDMDPVQEIARRHGLMIIEDAAEAHGLMYKGRQCGGFGDVSIFSFYPNKHIVCGEGGMVLTSDDSIAERARSVRNLFFDHERRYIHEEFGSNFRMTNMQAAIGCAQLEKINGTIARKREIGMRYLEAFRDIEGIRLPVSDCDFATNVFWVFGLVVTRSDWTKDELMMQLAEKEIGTRHFFYPMHKQPALLNSGCCSKATLNDSGFPNSNFISEHGFYLPSGVGLTDSDQDYVIENVLQLLN